MPACNREIVKTIESVIEMDSTLPEMQGKCENNLPNADIIDIITKKDQLHFYEKTNFDPCQDIWLISNEECLWQAIVGEIKTPYGLLSNSIGQNTYGCRIWDLVGENIDSLVVKEFEADIIETCLKYPEVKNVIDIDTKVGDNDAFLCTITIDSIYGVFDGVTHIPLAYPSNKVWKSSTNLFQSRR